MKRFLPLIILTVISFAIIFFKFNEIPIKLFHDETDFKQLALSLDNKPYTPYSPLATGHATLYFYIILFSLKIFGATNFALRLPSAVFGVFNVIIFYFIFSLSFRAKSRNPLIKYFPFILSIVFITMRWYFNFARFSFEATFLLFLELASIFFFLRYCKNNRTLDICLSSFFAGLAYNSYTPGRIFFILIFGFLIFEQTLKNINGSGGKAGRAPDTAQRSEQWRGQALTESGNRQWKNIILPIIIFLVVISPLSYYLMTHQDNRFDKQFFLKNTEMTVAEKASFLWENVQKTVLMFDIQGDVNARHNYPKKPALNPILGILSFAGLVLTIRKIRRFPDNFFLAYFFISIIPAILTYPWENPNMLRSFAVIPSLVYFIGNSLNYLLSLKFNKRLILGIIITVILVSSIYELRTYFIYQAQIINTSF